MTNYTENCEKDRKIKKQSMSLSLAGILSKAIEAIVGYIAIYFFAPLWKKITKHYFEKPNNEKS
jgi:hypothetical protein